MPMSYSSTGTSVSHNNVMEGEVMDSRPTECVSVSLTNGGDIAYLIIKFPYPPKKKKTKNSALLFKASTMLHLYFWYLVTNIQ